MSITLNTPSSLPRYLNINKKLKGFEFLSLLVKYLENEMAFLDSSHRENTTYIEMQPLNVMYSEHYTTKHVNIDDWQFRISNNSTDNTPKQYVRVFQNSSTQMLFDYSVSCYDKKDSENMGDIKKSAQNFIRKMKFYDESIDLLRRSFDTIDMSRCPINNVHAAYRFKKHINNFHTIKDLDTEYVDQFKDIVYNYMEVDQTYEQGVISFKKRMDYGNTNLYTWILKQSYILTDLDASYNKNLYIMFQRLISINDLKSIILKKRILEG